LIIRRPWIAIIEKRLNKGELGIWDTLPLSKIGTFSTVECQSKQKEDRLRKEEKSLLQRFLIVQRKRPGFDVEENVCKYEFCNYSPALFGLDGFVHFADDKSKLMHQIEAKTEASSTKVIETTEEDKILIIDAMHVVHSITILKNTNCLQFYEKIFIVIESRARKFDEIRLIFDR
jgi:hypothetical protein